MREILIGLAVAILIALVSVYLYAPQLFESWVHRLFLMH
jgi:hypothetical protein